MKKALLLSIIPLFACFAGPGITIDIEPYPIGEINIPDPGGLACR
jgi:hypothetical protein